MSQIPMGPRSNNGMLSGYGIELTEERYFFLLPCWSKAPSLAHSSITFISRQAVAMPSTIPQYGSGYDSTLNISARPIESCNIRHDFEK